MLNRLAKSTVYTILLAWLVVMVVPMLWIFFNAGRSTQEIVENPFGTPWLISGSPYADVPGQPTPIESAQANFSNAWTESGFSTFFLNSVLVTSIALIGILAVSAMAAYVLVRFPFRGSGALHLYFISGMMIPAQLVLIPLFFQFSTLSDFFTFFTAPFGFQVQLHNSLTGLITIYIALSLPFTILLLTGFFKSIPRELREAAIIDGCSEFGAFRRVMLPLAKPGVITAAIFNCIGLWNEYLFALVFVNTPEKKTLPLGLASLSLQAQYKTDFGLLFAGLVIILIPTLITYALLQRQLTSGITVGALKG